MNKDKSIYVIFALLFGVLGVHNFYAKRYGFGIAQLCVFIFTGWLIVPVFALVIWAVIEAIVVNQTGDGSYMYK